MSENMAKHVPDHKAKMQFFNFGNAPTYHFFKWVRDGGKLDAEKLIAKAMERVEGDEWFAMGIDVSTVARDKLAELLDERLDEEEGEYFDEVMRWEVGTVDTSAESLMLPILREALGQIDLKAVAEALLISAGKWNPDRDLPDF